MAFTGHKVDEPLFVQRVGMAVSDDLVRGGRSCPRTRPARRTPRTTSWCPPVSVRSPTGGTRSYWTRATRWSSTSARGAPRATYPRRGTVGLARSTDMRTTGRRCRRWSTTRSPRRWRSRRSTPSAAGTTWYSAPRSSGCPRPTSPGFPGHTFRSTDYSMVGDSPLGPFRIHGTGEIMPTAPPSSRYASQLVHFEGEWFLLSTVREDSGLHRGLRTRSRSWPTRRAFTATWRHDPER